MAPQFRQPTTKFFAPFATGAAQKESSPPRKARRRWSHTKNYARQASSARKTRSFCSTREAATSIWTCWNPGKRRRNRRLLDLAALAALLDRIEHGRANQ